LFANRREVTFPLKGDQFFVLGDNSPASKDSRLWSQDTRSWSMENRSWSGEHPEFYVKRELLIGKALFIYWPHSFDRLPYLNIPFPYFPNFKDMGFVR
jgi:signal peptidase I